jgi:tripartite-type tricarboxylate transporter receptor subunit TctC
VLNKPGANGQLAVEEMARSAPDGYTLMIGNVTTNTIAPVLFGKKWNINYEKDVVAVSRLVDIPAFLVVTTKNFEPKTVAEFIAEAKKNPGKLSYGTVGVGSYPHYDFAYFAKRASIDLVGLPNKAGASGVITDMLRGDVHAAFLNVASTGTHVQAGNMRALALVNHQRLPEYPNVPTMKEVGYPEVGTLAWQGLFAPAGTPQPVLDALFKSVTQAMNGDAAKENFKKQNFNIVPNQSLAEAKTWLAGEMKAWKEITDQVKIDVGQ